MAMKLSDPDRMRIESGIQAKYRQVAVTPEGHFRYPTGRVGLEMLGYDPEIIKNLPGPVAECFCGVGNPFSLGRIQPGEKILDIGCGAGVDSLVAAFLVGPTGEVAGVDPTPEMVARARQNARLAEVTNVNFQEADAENLPFPADTFDTVISNSVFNLVVDKPKALAEVYRVLKPGGPFLLADQVLVGEMSEESNYRVENWAR